MEGVISRGNEVHPLLLQMLRSNPQSSQIYDAGKSLCYPVQEIQLLCISSDMLQGCHLWHEENGTDFSTVMLKFCYVKVLV